MSWDIITVDSWQVVARGFKTREGAWSWAQAHDWGQWEDDGGVRVIEKGDTNMSGQMVLVMIDELGDETEVERYTLQLELDSDEIEIWKDRKLVKARERWPEARGFYFEDRRNWGNAVRAMVREDFGF